MYVTVISPGLEEALAGRTATCENWRNDGEALGTLATWTMEEQSAKVRKLFLQATRSMFVAAAVNSVHVT
jgi:hypothetical protein